MALLRRRVHQTALRLIMSEISAPLDEHLSSDDVAAYVESRVSDAERRRIDSHLSACDLCRAEIIEVRSMIRSVPPARMAPRTLGVIGAVAAGLVLIAIPWRDLRRSATGGADVATERAVLPDAGRDSVVIVAPVPNASVVSEPLTFVWLRGVNDAQFRVTLLNTRGDIRWVTTTRDSAVVVPDSAIRYAGESYVFYVDALRADGTSARSSPRTFTVRR